MYRHYSDGNKTFFQDDDDSVSISFRAARETVYGTNNEAVGKLISKAEQITYAWNSINAYAHINATTGCKYNFWKKSQIPKDSQRKQILKNGLYQNTNYRVFSIQVIKKTSRKYTKPSYKILQFFQLPFRSFLATKRLLMFKIDRERAIFVGNT